MSWSIPLLLTALAIGATAQGPALATPGDRDPTFSRDGLVRTSYGERDAGADEVELTTDGAVIVAGTVGDREGSRLLISRYDEAGRHDGSYGDSAEAALDFASGVYVTAAFIDETGRIVIGGSLYRDRVGDADAFLLRLLGDGELDTTFGEGGVTMLDLDGADENVGNIAAAPRNGTAIFGTSGSQALVALLDDRGQLDPGFSGDGWLRTNLGGEDEWTSLSAGVVSPDGSFIAAGSLHEEVWSSQLLLARFEPDGDLDASFSEDGTAIYPPRDAQRAGAGAVALDPEGGILTKGRWCSTDFFIPYCDGFVARIRPDGSLDPGFGAAGYASLASNLGDGLEVDAEGRIIAVGGEDGGRWPLGGRADFTLDRLTASGFPDPALAGDGHTETDFHGRYDTASDAALAPDGRIISVGSSQGSVALTRYEAAFGKPDKDADELRDDRDRCVERFSKRKNGCPRHPRAVSLRWRRAADVFSGRVRSREPHCAAGEQVRVFRERRGRDRLVNSVRTGFEGEWKVDASLQPGRYYALVNRTFGRRVGTCSRARSRYVEIRA